jgi:hypothetical protein
MNQQYFFAEHIMSNDFFVSHVTTTKNTSLAARGGLHFSKNNNLL